MPLLTSYDPPGNLRDFDAVAQQGEHWHKYIQAYFQRAIGMLGRGLMTSGTAGIPQFYDAAVECVGATIEQEIVWNAFPSELLRRFGRDEALHLADTLWPLPAYQLGWGYDPYRPLPSNNELVRLLAPNVPFPREFRYRPQTEYCEWHSQRDKLGRLQRVTFTCEPPEYWQAMFGGSLPGSGVVFPGCQSVVLCLYQHLVNTQVRPEEILGERTWKSPLGSVGARGYNPYNKWNTTHGIAHLCAPPNALIAELMLAAQATRVHKSARDETVVLPDVLVAGAEGLGIANRNSDVAIVAAVNALARQGRRVTLSNPVGIYMDHIDLTGWKFPGGLKAHHCVRLVRGKERMMTRLVVEMPDPKLALSDISIGGVPILFGGQIAECITVKLRATATVAGGIANERLLLTVPAFVYPDGGSEVFASSSTSVPPPAGTVHAFMHEASPRLAAMPASVPQTREELHEPLLDLDQIQGIAIPGFLKPHQTLLCVRHDRSELQIRKLKALLFNLLPEISTGLATLEDRNNFRGGKHARRPLTGIAFTWCGLRCLTATAEGIRSTAFRQGLAARSALLGDPTEPGEPGHPSSWVVGGPADIPDFIVVIAGDDRAQVDLRADEISERIRAAGCWIERQDGDKLERSGKSREHFGFVDGISQPGIRGRVRAAPNCFITPSRIDEWPASGLYGYPGQALVWPGEFVLGYAKSGPDPLLPGPIAKPDLPWMSNGSYLVYSRLLQSVGQFWKTMREEAARLSAEAGFSEISAEGLASRLVGRTRNGVPVSRLQGQERAFHEGLGNNPCANNHFRFDSDTPRLKLLKGSDTFPQARADPLGVVCPLAAHIRKVNPRDSASDMGGENANYQHRILRVGVSFGPKREKLKSDPAENEPERGQLFLCIQASIEEQFEFLQARWMNDDTRPKSPGGHDMLAARNPSTGNGVRRCAIFGAEGQKEEVRAPQPFVTSSGGAYFFVPSLNAIKCVLAAQ